jgi:hypothetical protein
MTQETMLRSDCCNADMGTSFGDEGTNFHFCMKCKKPCDALSPRCVPKEWWEKLEIRLSCNATANHSSLGEYGKGWKEAWKAALEEMRRIEDQGEK